MFVKEILIGRLQAVMEMIAFLGQLPTARTVRHRKPLALFRMSFDRRNKHVQLDSKGIHRNQVYDDTLEQEFPDTIEQHCKGLLVGEILLPRYRTDKMTLNNDNDVHIACLANQPSRGFF